VTYTDPTATPEQLHHLSQILAVDWSSPEPRDAARATARAAAVLEQNDRLEAALWTLAADGAGEQGRTA